MGLRTITTDTKLFLFFVIPEIPEHQITEIYLIEENLVKSCDY